MGSRVAVGQFRATPQNLLTGDHAGDGKHKRCVDVFS